MHKFLLSGSILLSTAFAYAQKEVGFAEQQVKFPTIQKDYKFLNEKAKAEPVIYTPASGLNNGEVQIYNRIHVPLMYAANKVGGFSVSSGYTLFPALNVVSFDKDLKPKSTLEYIHLYDVLDKQQPYEYEATGQYFAKAASSKTDKRLADLQKSYPPAFAPFSFTPTEKTTRGIGYSLGARYDVYQNSSSVTGFNSVEMTPLVGNPKSSSYSVDLRNYPVKLVIYDNNVYNPNQDTWTVVAGENLEGKENKWSEYRNFHFITTNKSGNVIKDDTINFKYARGPILTQYAKDVEDPSKGKVVYVFGKANVWIGAKFFDPDKTKYQIAVFNNDGSIAYKHDFNFGTEGYQFDPVFTYVKNDKVYLLAAKQAANAPHIFQLFEADANGIKQVDQDAKEIFGSPNAAIGKNMLKWQWYDYKVTNNQLIIWGEHSKVVQQANTNMQTGQKTPEIIHYLNFAAVQIDLSTNKVIGQYAFERTEGDLTKKTDVEEVVIIGNKLNIIVAESRKMRDLSDITSGKLNFYNNSQYAKSGLNYMNLSRPVIYTVDFGGKKAGTYHVSAPDYLSLYPRNSYYVDGNFIYLLGFKDEKAQNAITYQVAKVSFE